MLLPRISLSLLIFLTIGHVALSQESMFARHFGNNVSILSVLQTTDLGFLAAGAKTSRRMVYPSLIKLDNNGAFVWAKNYRTSSGFSGSFTGITQGSNQSAVAIGFRQTLNGSDTDPLILKVDKNGKVIWQKVIKSPLSDNLYSVVETSDGGYLLTGSTLSFGLGDFSDAWVVKLNSSGKAIWSRSFGRSGEDVFYYGGEVPDGYIVAGMVDILGTTEFPKAVIVKLDKTGNEKWKKLYSVEVPEYMEIYTAAVTTDGECLLAGGYTSDIGHKSLSSFVLKTDRNGKIVWAKAMSRGDGGLLSSIFVDEKGNYIAVGESARTATDRDGLIVKLDPNGNPINQVKFGGRLSYDTLYSVAPAKDSGIVLAGVSIDLTGVSSDVPVIVKTGNQAKIAGCGILGNLRLSISEPRIELSNQSLETGFDGKPRLAIPLLFVRRTNLSFRTFCAN